MKRAPRKGGERAGPHDWFLEVAAYRGSIYTKQFPTGSWLEVKGLALPEFMIEIELEAHRPE